MSASRDEEGVFDLLFHAVAAAYRHNELTKPQLAKLVKKLQWLNGPHNESNVAIVKMINPSCMRTPITDDDVSAFARTSKMQKGKISMNLLLSHLTVCRFGTSGGCALCGSMARGLRKIIKKRQCREVKSE